MKIFVTVFLLCIVCLSLFAQIPLNLEHSANALFKTGIAVKSSISHNPHPAPVIEFISNIDGDSVIPLMESFYDNSPFSYIGHAIHQQPAISHPNEFPAGGTFISIMGSEDENATRYAYYSYLNSSGELIENSRINPTSDAREGYPSFAVDNLTGDVIATWHAISVENELYKSFLNSNTYHYIGTHQNWQTQHQVIEEPSFANEEYIFPQIRIGPSPHADHRRAHFYASYFNFTSNNHNAHPVYGYADFTTEQLESECILEWNFHTIPYLSQNHKKHVKR